MLCSERSLLNLIYLECVCLQIQRNKIEVVEDYIHYFIYLFGQDKN